MCSTRFLINHLEILRRLTLRLFLYFFQTKEEQYARSVIQAYGLGLLDLPTGEQSLRSYLAKKLHCSPSRITKKFKGQAPMNILDAQRLCRSRLREGRCRTSQERAETMKALGILEREFLMEIALMQEANATTPVAHDGLSPLTASPDKSPTHQWYHPQIYSPTVLSSPCGGSTSTAPFVTSPIWPHPPPTQNNDDLLQMSLTLNNVLSSLLQSTCAANRLGSSMMSQRQANLAPRPGTNIFEQQLNCPENRSQRYGTS